MRNTYKRMNLNSRPVWGRTKKNLPRDVSKLLQLTPPCEGEQHVKLFQRSFPALQLTPREGGEQNNYLVNIQRSLASYASFLDIKTTCPISNKEKVIGPPASEVAV